MGEAMFVVFVSCIALSCAIMIGENQLFLNPFFFKINILTFIRIE